MESLWKNVLDTIESKVNDHVFQTWFKPTEQLSYENGVLTVSVPSQFFKEWLGTMEYKKMIEKSLEEVAKVRAIVRFQVSNSAEEREANLPSKRNEAQGVQGSWPNRLNSSYTFENFVVGASNQFAHAASIAVSESPAKSYNPLFIYGGVGLGKTHLMHAMGHHILKRSPLVRLLYLTSEGFVNDLIASLQRDRMEGFRNKYRNIDILLIDDIQFISGKDRTQEEFFHTFNSLYETKKQIVISSDRFPKEMSALEERLRSRFEWGLIADIQPPDLETKLAILRKKAEALNINIANDVSYYIASRIKSNIRELEGSLLRLGALSELTGAPITLEMAKKSLCEVLQVKDNPPSIEKIQKIVAEHFDITVMDLKSRKRNKSIAIPRQIAMYLIREYTSASLPETGRCFGNKDHTTVLHSYRKIRKIVENGQSWLIEAIKTITDKLNL